MKKLITLLVAVAMAASCKKTTQVSDTVLEEDLYETEDTCEAEEPNDTLSADTIGTPIFKASDTEYKDCGTFKHFSIKDTCLVIVKTKNYTDSIEHEHVANLDWPLKISAITNEDLSYIQKEFIYALFGKDVKSSDIQKVLTDFIEKERKELNASSLNFRFERRQGNFLVFKEKYSYPTGFEADVDSREYTFLYNTRTKKVITKVKDLGIDAKSAYKAFKLDARKQIQEWYREVEERDATEEDIKYYLWIPELPEIIEGKFFIDDDLRTLSYPIHRGTDEGIVSDVHLKIRDFVDNEFIDDWYGRKTGK